MHTPRFRSRVIHVVAAFSWAGASVACELFDRSGTVRQAGQVEFFEITPGSLELARPLTPGELLTASRQRDDLTQNWGNPLRFTSHVVTI